MEKELEKIVKDNMFNPEEIGISILKLLGYTVNTYRNDGKNSIYVYDKENKTALYYNN